MINILLDAILVILLGCLGIVEFPMYITSDREEQREKKSIIIILLIILGLIFVLKIFL